ncbi:hypothetical protein BGZ52_009571, partial [Haplosporangium bisporale]
MSEEDMVLALAIYVPNLSHFRDPHQRYGKKKGGFRFLKSVLDVERLKKDGFLRLKSREGCSDRLQRLVRVVADYKLTLSDWDRFGLVYARPHSMSAAMQDAG